jgi:hypothetical protein
MMGDLFDLLGGPDEEFEPYAPKTNGELSRNTRRREGFNEIGLTADRFEIRENTASLTIDRREPTVRSSENAPGDGPTVDELRQQPLGVEEKGDTVTITGRMSPVIGTAVIMRGSDGGEKLWTLARPEVESVGRGKSGPTGMMQTLPERQFGRETESEMVGFAKSSENGQDVIVGIDTGEAQDVQVRRILRGKQQIIRSRQQKLQGLLRRKGGSTTALKEETDKVKKLMRYSKVVLLKQKKTNPAIADLTKRVTIDFGTEQETTDAIVRFDGRRPTFIKPITIEPGSAPIVEDSLYFVDGNGDDRAAVPVDTESRDQVEYMREVARNLGRPKPVQEKSYGAIVLPPSIEAQQWVHPQIVRTTWSRADQNI